MMKAVRKAGMFFNCKNIPAFLFHSKEYLLLNGLFFFPGQAQVNDRRAGGAVGTALHFTE